MFTTFTAVCFFIICAIYLFPKGRGQKTTSTRSEPARSVNEKGEREVRREIYPRFCTDEETNRQTSRRFKELFSQFKTGDYIDREPGGDVRYKNTVFSVWEDHFEMGFVNDYADFDNDDEDVDYLRFQFRYDVIEDVVIHPPKFERDPVYMVIKRLRTKRFREMLFEFHGPDRESMAAEAKRRILKERDRYLGRIQKKTNAN